MQCFSLSTTSNVNRYNSYLEGFRFENGKRRLYKKDRLSNVLLRVLTTTNNMRCSVQDIIPMHISCLSHKPSIKY